MFVPVKPKTVNPDALDDDDEVDQDPGVNTFITMNDNMKVLKFIT